MLEKKPASGSSLVYNQQFRSLLFQILTVLALSFFVWWLFQNVSANLAEQGKKTGFAFLNDTAGFQILDTLGTYLTGYVPGQSTNWDIFRLGMINTIAVAVVGIFFATVIGFVLGVMRLSKNFVIRSFATVYIEILRNVPLLLQIFFWYFFVLRILPGPRDKLNLIGDAVAINIRGLHAPAPIPEEGFGWVGIAFVLAIILGIVFSNYAKKLQESTGKRLPVFWIQIALVIGLPGIIHILIGQPLTWEMPTFSETGSVFKRGFGSEGMVIKPEMSALILALALYTAAFIAEIVRAGILSVSKGQSEAASALGVKPNDSLRLVIIPQAMRVIVPPLTSQFLNLTKNSSLAVAIAYPDVVSVFAGTTLNQVGQAIEIMSMVMAFYLVLSLLTSTFMNWFNSRIKLMER